MVNGLDRVGCTVVAGVLTGELFEKNRLSALSANLRERQLRHAYLKMYDVKQKCKPGLHDPYLAREYDPQGLCHISS